MPRAQKIAAALALAVAAGGWSLSPVFIRVLSGNYDVYTQAFIRYSSAVVVLVPISLLWFPRDFLRMLRSPLPLVVLACVNALTQLLWTAGCYGAPPTLAQLISKLSIIFVIVFSFTVFREERAIIRSPRYLLGTLLGLIGVAGVLADEPGSLRPVFDGYILILFVVAIGWAGYTVLAKHLVAGRHPVPMFTVVAIATTAAFVPFMFALGDPGQLTRAGLRVTTIAFLSGTLPIAAAHPAFYYAQKRLGAAFCGSIILLNPLLTYAFARIVWPDEHLLAIQWIGGGILLAGVSLVTHARARNQV